MLNIRQRLSQLEAHARPTDREAVLILPENGTEPRGYVQRMWDRFAITLRQTCGVLIVPSGQTVPKA